MTNNVLYSLEEHKLFTIISFFSGLLTSSSPAGQGVPITYGFGYFLPWASICFITLHSALRKIESTSTQHNKINTAAIIAIIILLVWVWWVCQYWGCSRWWWCFFVSSSSSISSGFDFSLYVVIGGRRRRDMTFCVIVSFHFHGFRMLLRWLLLQ